MVRNMWQFTFMRTEYTLLLYICSSLNQIQMYLIFFIYNFNAFRINILQVFFYKKKKVICKLAQDFVTLVKLSSKIDQDRYAVIINFFCVPKYSKILWKLYSLKKKECYVPKSWDHFQIYIILFVARCKHQKLNVLPQNFQLRLQFCYYWIQLILTSFSYDLSSIQVS